MDTLDAADSIALRQRALFAFEVEWAKGACPTAAEFAAPFASAGDRLLRELVVAEFRNRWKAGDAIPAELFLRKHYPQFRGDAEVILFLVAAEVELHPGEPDEAAYASRFPEQAADLHEWFRLRREVSAHWTADPAILAGEPDETIDHRRDSGGEALAFRPGEEFVVADRFTITRPLGEGGFKVVFEAVQRNAGRAVAFKVPKSANLAGTVLDEGRVVAQLEHQNIPPVMTVGGPDSGGIVAERLIQGRDWREVMRSQRKQRNEERDDAIRLALWRMHLRANLAVLLDVCKALRYAHERLRIIHRDVKPQNVMLGGFGEVYLVDWGLAVHVGDAQDDVVRAPHRSVAPGMCGTPAYMAPEMARGESGKLSLATDVFLLGATLHEVLCGKPPYAGPNLVLVFNLAQTRTFFPAESETSEPVPTELAAVVKKATAFDPVQRYPDAGAFAAAVETYLAHADTEDRLRVTAAEHEQLKARLGARRGREPLYPLITPLIEVADQYSEAARELGAGEAVAEVRGRAVAGEREARYNLVDLAEASGDFALAEAQLERIAGIAGTDAHTVATRRVAVQKQAARVRQTKWLFRSAAATAALLAVGVGLAVLSASEFRAEREIARANEKAADTRAANERLEKDAALTRAKFDEERKLAAAAMVEARSIAEAKRSKADVFAGLGRQLRFGHFDQAAALNLAAAVEADDTPAARAAWVDACQSSLVPVAVAPSRTAAGALAYSSDGTKLISGDFAYAGVLRVWDLNSGEQVRVLPGHPAPEEPYGLSSVRRLVFHPAEPNVVFSAGQDGTVLATDIATGEQRRSSKVGEPAGVQFLSVDVSPKPGPDGRYRLVTGDTAKRIIVWDAATLRPLNVLPGQRDIVAAVRFDPLGTKFAAGTGKQAVVVCDRDGVRTGEIVVPALPERRTGVSDLAFSADGQHLVVALDHPDIQVWNMATATLAHTLKGHEVGVGGRDWALRLAVAPNGRLFSTGYDGTVREWDIAAGTPVGIRGRHEPNLEGLGMSLAVAADPTGRELATTGADFALRRWRAADGAPLAETRGQPRRLLGTSAVVWMPNSDRLLALSSHGSASARLWDANRLHPLREFSFVKVGEHETKRVPVAGVASPDERTVYVAMSSGAVLELDFRTGAVRHTFADIHETVPLEREAFGFRMLGPVLDIALTPDGRRLLTLGSDRALKVWDTAGRKLVREIDLTADAPDAAVRVAHRNVFSEADGLHAVTLGDDGQLYRWRLSSGERVQALAAHPHSLTAGQFSADGRLFASGSAALVIIWDATTWKPIRTVHLPALGESVRPATDRFSATGQQERETTLKVWSLAFSRDRRLLAATQLDGSLTVIDVVGGQVVARTVGHASVDPHPWLGVFCRFTRANRLVTASDQGELFEWDLARSTDVVTVQSHYALYGLTPSSDFSEWASPGLIGGVARTPADARNGPAIDNEAFFQGWYAQQRAHWPKTEIARLGGKTATLVDRPRMVQFVPNSTKLVVANEHGSGVVLEKDAVVARFAPPLRIPVWIRQKEAGKPFSPDPNLLTALAVDPRGELVAQGSRAGVVDLWRVADGTVVHTLEFGDRVPMSVAFRPTGPRQLAVLLDDGNFAVWDLDAQAERVRTAAQARGIGGEGKIAYAPDGRTLAHVGIGRAVALYDADTGALRQRLAGHRELLLGNRIVVAEVIDVAFGPGGDLLATCGSDGWVWLWKRDAAGQFREHLTVSTATLASVLDPPADMEPERTGPALPSDLQRQRLRYLVFGKDGTTLYTGGLMTPLYRIDLIAAERWLTRPPEELVAETERATGLRRTPDGLAPLDRNRMVFPAKK